MHHTQARRALSLTGRLARALAGAQFSPPVAYTYHPLVYAAAGWRAYISRYGDGDKPVLLVGMNPGPFGMAQTGVPFGAIGPVRDWLDIDVPIAAPAKMHPKRPIDGFACRRQEVSGARLWGWLAARFGTPKRLFASTMVINLCPLLWLDEGGRNLTPDRLPQSEQRPVQDACRATLAALVALWRTEMVVGVGAYAAAQARLALAGSSASVGQILHPSPASPLANRGWAEQASAQMKALRPEWGPNGAGAERRAGGFRPQPKKASAR